MELRADVLHMLPQFKFSIRSLYLYLSAIFGVLPARRWSRIFLTFLTVFNASVIAYYAHINWRKWINVESSMFGFFQIVHLVAINAFILIHARSVRGHSTLFRHLDQKRWWPEAFTAFQMTCFAYKLFSLMIHQPKITLTVLSSLSQINLIILGITHALIIAQYGAFIDTFSSKISSMAATLRKEGPLTMVRIMRQKSIHRSILDAANAIFLKQMVFVAPKVLTGSVLFGYFLFMDPTLDLYTMVDYILIIVRDAVALNFITLSCNRAQNAVKSLNFELVRALRNHPYLLTNSALALEMKLEQPLGFKAGGFIELSNGLVTSMVATVTTYLVTLVQFSEDQ